MADKCSGERKWSSEDEVGREHYLSKRPGMRRCWSFSFCFANSNTTFRYPEFALEAWAWVGEPGQTGGHTLLAIKSHVA